MQMAESSVTARLKGTSSAGSGPDLTGYPQLVYAPAQWGEGVRVASNGAALIDIRRDCEVQVDELISIADQHDVTLRELFDAILYSQES